MLDTGWYLQEAGEVVCTSTECSRNPEEIEVNPAWESQGELFLRNVLVTVLFPSTIGVCWTLMPVPTGMKPELTVIDYLGWLPAGPKSCSALSAVGPTLSKALGRNAGHVRTGCVGRERPLVDCQLPLPRPKRSRSVLFLSV